MSQFIILLNHTLTQQQQDDARKTLGISGFVIPPESLKNQWQQIPADLHNITAYLTPIIKWLEQNMNTDDFLLVQGDFGASFYLVDWALNNGFTPVYSTTKRIARESHQDNGTVNLQHHFCHIRYRTFKKWSL